MNNKTRSQGEDFPGHFSQARSSPSNNFGAPTNQGIFWDKQEAKETCQTKAEVNINPDTRAETKRKIGHQENLNSLCGHCQ